MLLERKKKPKNRPKETGETLKQIYFNFQSSIKLSICNYFSISNDNINKFLLKKYVSKIFIVSIWV